MRAPGRHFLQIPGPSSVPERILAAIGNQTIDHRGPDFAEIGAAALSGMKEIFQTNSHVFIYPSSGTGAWEAAFQGRNVEESAVIVLKTGFLCMQTWSKH